MKLYYRFHPKKYDIEATEDFYEKMATDGCLLIKRGFLLSSFLPAPEERTNFQVVLCTPKYYINNKTRMNEKLPSLCGWKYVTHSHGYYIYSSSDDVTLDSFYRNKDEKNDAETKFKPKVPFSLLTFIYFLVTSFFHISSYRSTLAEQLDFFYHQNRIIFFLLPTVYISFLCYLLLLSIDTIYFTHLFRSYKEHLMNPTLCTNPVQTAPSRLYTIVHRILAILMITFLIIDLFRYIQKKEYELPTETTDPYLLFSDMGYEGSRASLPTLYAETNQADSMNSYLCNYWNTNEYIYISQHSYLMNQEVFYLRKKSPVDFLVRSLMETSTKVKTISSFQRSEYEGLDTVYISTEEYGYTYIIVKSNYIYRISFIIPDDVDRTVFQTNVLSAITSKSR